MTAEDRMCSLCEQPIEDVDWDSRHDIGEYVAHADCCIRAGCEEWTECEGQERLPLTFRNARAT